jgi:hypothetical protein
MKTGKRIFTVLALVGIVSIWATSVMAWCTPEALNCGNVITRNLNQTPWHNDIATYNCTGSTTWNGHSHVYRIYPPQNGALRFTLEWTPTTDPNTDIHLFVLSSCNQNACIGHTADTLTIPNAVANDDYWVIIDGRGAAANPRSYTLTVTCGDNPLAAELQSFDAAADGDAIAVNWSVASETNNDYFALQRSTDNNDHWLDIARIAGRGTASSGATYAYDDQNVISGHRYTYRLVSVQLDGASSILSTADVDFGPGAAAAAADFHLLGNYPNPFNPTTTIRYEALHDAEIMLEVFALDGRKLATLVDGFVEAGYHEVTFDGTSLGTGVYFARLTGASGAQMLKIVLMK